MDNQTARLLAAKGVNTQEELADLAVDDLVELTGWMRSAPRHLIMAARAPGLRDRRLASRRNERQIDGTDERHPVCQGARGAAALLLEQLQAAGVNKKLVDDTLLTEQDKTQLLEYLREVHGAKEAKNKITLTRNRPPRSRRRTAPARRAPSRSRCARSASWSSAMPRADAVPEAPVAAGASADRRGTDRDARGGGEKAGRVDRPSAAEVVAKQERREKKRKRRPGASRAGGTACSRGGASPAACSVAGEAAPARGRHGGGQARGTGTLHKPASSRARRPKRKPQETGQGSRLARRERQEAHHQDARRRSRRGRAGTQRKDRHAKVKTRGETDRRPHTAFRCRPSRSCARYWFPRRSRSPTSRRKCRSRRLRSSRH